MEGMDMDTLTLDEGRKQPKTKVVQGKQKLQPVWHDPDDDLMDADGIRNRRTKLEAKDGELYQSRLIQSFEMVYGPTPKWARLDKKNMKGKAHDVDKPGMVGEEPNPLAEYKQPLSLGKLEIVRVENLNSKRTEGAIIRSVDFHPINAVGLAAGNSVVSLYQVNGTSNPLIQSISFEDFPLRKAQFCCEGKEIYVSSGLMGHFYCYDMHSGTIRQIKPNHSTKHETIRNLVPSPDNKSILAVGHEGHMYLFSKSSKELIDTWSVNSEIKEVVFSSNGKEMLVQGATGEVYRWDMNTRSCVEKFSGEANFEGTCLAASSNYIACGSSSGFVSVFENKYQPVARNEVISCRIKKPLGEMNNLTTSISALKINRSEEILAMASVDKDNAVRLVHLPTRRTFPSFPSVSSNYGRCNSIAFSPNSGYISIGSNRGCAYLFRLKHYSSY